MSEFKKKYTFETRKKEADRVLEKYPNRVPIIVNCPDSGLQMDKIKFLVPSDLTVQEFLVVIKKRMNIKKEEGVFIFVNNTIPPMTLQMVDIYHQYKENDGFLYFTVKKEAVFGN